MQEGNVTLQAFTVFTITPGARSNGCIYGDDFNYAALLSIAQLRPPYLWFSPRERAIDQACRLAATSEASDAPGAGPSPCTIKAKGEGGGASGFLLVRTAGDLANLVKRRMDGQAVTGGFLGLEGAHALDRDSIALRPFFDAGFRMIALTHRFDNEYGGATEGCPPDYELTSVAPQMGLTEAGRRLLINAADQGMVIDLAHASSPTIHSATTMPELAGRAMVISHAGVQGTCPRREGHVVARNISDDDIRAIARTGGIIGVGFWPEAVCWKDDRETTQEERTETIVKAMAHIVSVLAEPTFTAEMQARQSGFDPMDHIAFGSDFDGAVKTPFDVSDVAVLTAAMQRFRDKNGQAVFDQRAVRKIAGVNVCRVLMAELPGGGSRRAQETCNPLMNGVPPIQMAPPPGEVGALTPISEWLTNPATPLAVCQGRAKTAESDLVLRDGKMSALANLAASRIAPLLGIFWAVSAVADPPINRIDQLLLWHWAARAVHATAA
jgi:microsomal dipeptidase-like Zn-dependent dipeptidase